LVCQGSEADIGTSYSIIQDGPFGLETLELLACVLATLVGIAMTKGGFHPNSLQHQLIMS
jgi:hypothetical protein